MKTPTSRSSWGKSSTKSIDLIGTMCILDIDKVTLHLSNLPMEHTFLLGHTFPSI